MGRRVQAAMELNRARLNTSTMKQIANMILWLNPDKLANEEILKATIFMNMIAYQKTKLWVQKQAWSAVILKNRYLMNPNKNGKREKKSHNQPAKK
jgi:hypothetical protein